MRAVFTLMLFCVLGCKRPADAPETLDKLTGFLYGHAMDDDPESLQAGFTNLRKWLSTHLEETQDGYTVDKLSQNVVNHLDGCERNIDGLIGAAVATRNTYSVEQLVDVLIDGNMLDVYQGEITAYKRDYLDDADCFLDQECDLLRYDTRSERKYPLGITGISRSRVQHRWVETDDGMSHISRSWLKHPADISVNWLRVKEQFYLNASLPWDNGGTVRMQATWAITEFGAGAVPENFALNLVIDTMKADDVYIEEYIDKQ